MRTSNFDRIAFKAKFQFKIESEHPIAVFVLCGGVHNEVRKDSSRMHQVSAKQTGFINGVYKI